MVKERPLETILLSGRVRCIPSAWDTTEKILVVDAYSPSQTLPQVLSLRIQLLSFGFICPTLVF